MLLGKSDIFFLSELFVIVFFVSLCVLSPVRVIKAPMGTKATPTASLSVMSVLTCNPYCWCREGWLFKFHHSTTFVMSAEKSRLIWPITLFVVDWRPRRTLRAMFSPSFTDHYGFMDWESVRSEQPAVNNPPVTTGSCVIVLSRWGRSALFQTWNELKLRNTGEGEGSRECWLRWG